MDRELLENLSLERVADGTIPLSFLEALSEKILPNIFDINTDSKGERSITLTIRFRPTLDRYGQITGADILVDDPKCKLISRRSITTHVLLGKIGNEYQAKEIRQLNINDDVEDNEQHGPEKPNIKFEIIK